MHAWRRRIMRMSFAIRKLLHDTDQLQLCLWDRSASATDGLQLDL